jgi:hypothetical protein
MTQHKKDIRLELIQQQLVRFVRFDFSENIPLSEKNDEIDAIIIGLNTLGEELRTTEILRT